MNTRYTSAILAVFLGLGTASCTNMPNLNLPGTQQNAGTTTAGNVPQALPNHNSGSSVGYQNASYNSNTTANTATENYSYANYGTNSSGSGSYYDNYDSYSNQNNNSNTYSGTGSYYDTTTGSNYDYNTGTVNTAALPGGAYAVQILATVSNGKASDLQRQMESMGYPAVVDFIEGLHKVRIPYQSKAQAHANLESIRAAANEPQAFVATR